MAFKGKVKVICIDPPYNTGNKDFIYNDAYLDKDDRFRHSTWLEFMYRRLLLAKELLRNDGVIFVNIGDEEFGHLSMLMDKVFPGMKVGTFVWKRRSGSNDAKGAFLSVDHEYVLCYGNGDFRFGGELKKGVDYDNPDGDARGPWVSGDLSQGKTMKQRPDAFYQICNPQTDTWYPCDPGNAWRFASETKLKPGQKIRTKTMEQLIEEKRVLWPANERTIRYETLKELTAAIEEGSAPHNLKSDTPDLEFWVGKSIGYGKPRYKRFWNELKNREKPLSTWIVPASSKNAELKELEVENAEFITTGYTTEGTALLQKIMGHKDFSYPKPLSLIKALISQATSNDSGDIILDFFGGSATTGHAVLEINAEDDGNRRFIIVSSSEATKADPEKNVCRDIARTRLERIIKGFSYRQKGKVFTVDAVPGELAYCTLSKIPAESVGIQIRHEQVWIALQLMHDGRLAPFSETAPFQIATSDDQAIVYLQATTGDAVSGIEKAVAPFPSAVIYAWEPGIVRRSISHPGVTVKKIPDALTALTEKAE
ncbi:MAG TPA: site-specific DNA-methyltransferase [Candidatus Ozemobacteraceae bacterium]|nr:site-specific DNA-methyltransferase [Candidatus Ozemobacteraceae bacterium]